MFRQFSMSHICQNNMSKIIKKCKKEIYIILLNMSIHNILKAYFIENV